MRGGRSLSGRHGEGQLLGQCFEACYVPVSIFGEERPELANLPHIVLFGEPGKNVLSGYPAPDADLVSFSHGVGSGEAGKDKRQGQ